MGFLFTFLYVTISYLTPPIAFGPLAAYHVEIILILLAIIFSIPSLSRSGLSQSPQLIALVGMGVAIVMSVVLTGWLGGAVGAFYGFLQPTLTFCLVAANCKTKRHFQWIILALVASSTFFMVHGLMDLHNNVDPSDYIYHDGPLWRIRGLGFVNDPNDFAQVMVSLIPCLFLWRSKNGLANIFLIGVPASVLLVGMYFTHSRGAILALLAVIVVSVRRKIGTVPALVIAGGLLAASLALNWSGGREISMEGGSDRLDLWSEGLQMIKSHPLFGIGLNAFADYAGHTAHNSVVVCAAETGIVGLYFWTLFIASTLRLGVLLGFRKPVTEPAAGEAAIDQDSGAAASATGQGWLPQRLPHMAMGSRAFTQPPVSRAETERNTAAAPAIWAGHERLGKAAFRLRDVETPAGKPAWSGAFESKPGAFESKPGAFENNSSSAEFMRTEAQGDLLSSKEVGEMARFFIYALTGMLVAGWFLSRAFSQWLFLYCGMMYSLSRMQTSDGAIAVPDRRAFLLKLSAGVTVGLLVGLYLMLRFRLVSG